MNSGSSAFISSGGQSVVGVGDGVVVPDVAAVDPADIVAGAFGDDAFFDVRAFGQRFVDIAFERLPEILENILPGQFTHRDFIKLVFQIGCEVVLHIALKEFRQEGRYKTATVLCDKASAFKTNIVTVL